MDLKNKSLLASVFFTGFAVLVLEVLAIRILSPHYGSTIYTTSSVIAVVLSALSLGYFIGGKISDKYPDFRVFYGIIFLSGFLVIFINTLKSSILPLFSVLFPITTGPLISSFFLFFIPSFFLGTLSPFAIKLNAEGYHKIGHKSGEVFFWSTVGSILGSIISGFFLIPNFGIDSIILFTGIFLCLLGFLGLMFFINKKKEKTINFFVLIACLSSVSFLGVEDMKGGALYQKDGVYEKITIVDGELNGRPVRFLKQDKSGSAAMYLNSDELAYNYTKYYGLYKLLKPKAEIALAIGGGAYSIPKALLNDSPLMRVDVSEIEPELFYLAQKYFKLGSDPRLVNYIEDGRHLLARNNKKYDLIVSDVYYSFFSVPMNFTTKEFFSLARQRLSDRGIFVGNFIGDTRSAPPSFILSEIKTFKGVFSNSYFFAVSSPDSESAQNIIFLGINGENKIDFKSEAVLQNTDPIIRELGKKNIDVSKFTLALHREITDDFAPVEYLVGGVIERWY